MTIIPLNDQNKMTIQLENEFNIILTDSLGQRSTICSHVKALALVEEIRSLAKPRYFDEENLSFLEDLSCNIHSYLNNFCNENLPNSLVAA